MTAARRTVALIVVAVIVAAPGLLAAATAPTQAEPPSVQPLVMGRGCCPDPDLFVVAGLRADTRSVAERFLGIDGRPEIVLAVPSHASHLPRGSFTPTRILAAFDDPNGGAWRTLELSGPGGVRAFATEAQPVRHDAAAGIAYDLVLVLDVTAADPRAIAPGPVHVANVGPDPLEMTLGDGPAAFTIMLVKDAPWAQTIRAP